MAELTAEAIILARESKRHYLRRQSRDNRDIKAPPRVKSWKRRRATKGDLLVFCETYFGHLFTLAWSDSHKLLIRSVEQAIFEGGRQCIGYPRGTGKTSICVSAVIWATFHGHRVFPMLFGAEDSKAKSHLTTIKQELLTNQKLAADFPELCYPITESDGIANRANYQTCRGKSTELRFGRTYLVLPLIKESIARGNGGAIIGTGTLTGSAARGTIVRGTRPDFALVDDPQTRSSAKSPTQCEQRRNCVDGDILGMAGPDKDIAALMTCTAIYPNDLATHYLSRSKAPEWRGISISMIQEWPSDMDLWSQWNDVRVTCEQDGVTLERAHEFYREHREKLDHGSKVYWEARITPGFVSAIESAMALYFANPETFASEYQNEPVDKFVSVTELPSVEVLETRTKGGRRLEAPETATKVVSFIDVQSKVLYYTTVAWAPDFTGVVLDYGTWPNQGRFHFSLATARKTLFKKYPGAGQKGAWYKGIKDLIDHIEGQVYKRADGTILGFNRGFVDAMYGESTPTVYELLGDQGSSCRWMPSHGAGYRVTQRAFGESMIKRRDERGTNWVIPQLKPPKKIRHILYETNWWKGFVAERLSTEFGDPGALWFHKGRRHTLLAEHCHAEYAVEAEARGRRGTEWFLKPNKPDNHYWDCLVGCCVAGAVEGCSTETVKVMHIKPMSQTISREEFRQKVSRLR